MTSPSKSPWGRDDLMAIAAVRYCLGRQSYIVGDCVDWLIAQWPNFQSVTRRVIERDIEEAFERDDEVRSRRQPFKSSPPLPLGMDMDREQWERVRGLWKEDDHDDDTPGFDPLDSDDDDWRDPGLSVGPETG